MKQNLCEGERVAEEKQQKNGRAGNRQLHAEARGEKERKGEKNGRTMFYKQ